MDFPLTPVGRAGFWWFLAVYRGEKAVRGHADRELQFFRIALEKAADLAEEAP